MKLIPIAITLLACAGVAYGGEAQMKDMPMQGTQASQTHHATGVIRKVDAANDRLTIAHQPIKSLNWPAMTMVFRVQDKKLLDGMVEGKQVDFDFLQEGGKSVIVAIRPR